MASIVQRLATRSITGRDLGIDVHKLHDYYICFGNNTALNTVTHTYWNASFLRHKNILSFRNIYLKQVFLAHAIA